jgi:hypothetical protein
MRVYDYEVVVPEGDENATGYVVLEHNTRYTIKLMNLSYSKVDAEVFIDGNRIGEWRVNSFVRCIIERPVHDTGRFTFYRLDSIEAKNIGLKSSSELGLIKVIFKPEHKQPDNTNECACPLFDMSEGGTGLSGHSEQKFNTVQPLDSNPENYVTIYLRLAAPEESDARPLFPFSNPIPPPLGGFKPSPSLEDCDLPW